MGILTLTFEQVDMLHASSIDEFGGLKGSFNDTQERVESCLAQIDVVFGYERYKTIEEKAGALLYFLAKNHCYVDGNKRVAFACCDVFLLINGKELTLSEDDATTLVNNVASSNVSGQAIDEYIKVIANTIKENCI